MRCKECDGHRPLNHHGHCIDCQREIDRSNSGGQIDCRVSKPLYKTVTGGLRSLGLRNNPTILKYIVGGWVYSPTVKKGKADDGGIWVAVRRSGAETLKKYMKKKYNRSCRVYTVEIGDILYQNSYRLKTNKVKLVKAC